MKKLLLCAATAFLSLATMAQEQTIATFAAPFLTIAPDARATGMGSVGAATQGDVYSMYWNASKYSMAPDQFGVGVSYTPWMHGVQKGMNLITLNAYYQIGPKAGTVALGARYFTNPKLELGDQVYKQGNDFAIDLAYAYRIGDKFSVALAGRYISVTGLDPQGAALRKGAFTGDISATYQDKKQMRNGRMMNWGVGLNVSNLGSKVQMNDTKDFLPANIRLGGAFGFEMCEKHGMQFGLDFSKLLVPMAGYTAMSRAFDNMQDLIYGVGVEYNYNQMVFGRLGYSYQDENHGGLQYATIGVGGKYMGIGLDASYWIPTITNSPLKNTFRISLSYNF